MQIFSTCSHSPQGEVAEIYITEWIQVKKCNWQQQMASVSSALSAAPISWNKAMVSLRTIRMKPLKHIFRRLALTPMFTTVALVTLALGIGANTAIFSVLNGVLIKPLPYPQSDALVGVWHVAPGIASLKLKLNCSPTMYFTYREQNRTF